MAGTFSGSEAGAIILPRTVIGGCGLAPDAYLLIQRFELIRKLSSGKYRLYSRKKDPKTGRRRNLGTFRSRAAAERHERAVQFFKRR